ncbi:ATP-binding protein [Acetobacter cerevisiae]|uniref:Uncharacterized protein n=1 Tax=Acetobacter cerevisiae TaxID=178900 RepID=A0A149V6K9_9PROT|nr:ATP-binding protein [Acetobacter cerevisiae]KXV75819.1 hypothetical protein AD954_14220 [Acetobacter cerevisiae]
MRKDHAINIIGNVSGSHNRITQIYATSNAAMRPRSLKSFGDASPLSPEWLIYSERSVPFLGRDRELDTIKEMLADTRPFLWWAIVGNGGVGKSRLALEILLRVSETWSGGFVEGPPDPAAFAASPPTKDTIWIVDYAAEDVQRLRSVIPLLAQMAEEVGCKIRLLLIERGINAETGWWVDLTEGLSSTTVWISRNLYQEPLDLGPLQVTARELLLAIAATLPRSLANTLRTRVSEQRDDVLETWCDNGNPLVAQILAARLLDDPIGLRKANSSTRVVELYLARELERLGKKCRSTSLQSRLAILLLFMTTSGFPLPVAEPSPPHYDGHGSTSPNALLIASPPRPSTTQASQNLHARVDIMSILAEALNIDDASAYLALLEDAGFSASRNWAMLPDLLGETFIGFVANSRLIGPTLRAKRPDYKPKQLSRIYDRIPHLGLPQITTNWARLPDATILQLLNGLREAGRSLRFSLVIACQINFVRPVKLRWNVPIFLRNSKAHADGKELANFYEAIHASILNDEGTAAAKEFINSPHRWLMAYVFHLEVLPPQAQIRLARLICQICDIPMLLRRTNAVRLGDVVARVLSAAVSDATFENWQSYASETGQLAEIALDFTTDKLIPALCSSTESPSAEQDEVIARILMSVSFGLLRKRLGCRDTSVEVETRNAIVAALELKLQLPKLRHVILLRNAAALQARTQPDTVLVSYLATIRAISELDVPDELAAAISDAIFSASEYGDGALIEALPALLDTLPGRSVPKAIILGYVVDRLASFIEEEEKNTRTDKAVRLAMLGLCLVRGEREPWVDEELNGMLWNLLAFADQEAGARPAVARMLDEALALEMSQAPSPRVLAAMMRTAMIANQRWGEVAPLPTGVTVETVGTDVWALAARGIDPADFARSVRSISRIMVRSAVGKASVPGAVLYAVETFPDLPKTEDVLRVLATAQANLSGQVIGV